MSLVFIPELKIRLNKLTCSGKNWFTVLFIYLLIILFSPGALPLFRFLTANKISSSEISWSKISIMSWLSILSKSSSIFISSVFSSSFSFSYLKYSYNWSIVILIFLSVPYFPNLFRIFQNVFESCVVHFLIFVHDFYSFCSFPA
jgi:hypothetical protein